MTTIYDITPKGEKYYDTLEERIGRISIGQAPPSTLVKFILLDDIKNNDDPLEEHELSPGVQRKYPKRSGSNVRMRHKQLRWLIQSGYVEIDDAIANLRSRHLEEGIS